MRPAVGCVLMEPKSDFHPENVTWMSAVLNEVMNKLKMFTV